MRISKFWWHIIRMILGVSFIVFAVKVDFVSAWMVLQGFSFASGLIFSGIFLLIFGDEVYPLYPLKYRIVKKTEYSFFNNYLAQKLILKYILIPVWSTIDTNIHSYKSENIFGAKTTNLYRTDTDYKTEDDAREAIKKHKEFLIKEKVKLFKKPEKKNIKIIEV